jgi:CheY-like chemotaxis protein/DNA-directed RNA polymerase specialized sigma24 family protein
MTEILALAELRNLRRYAYCLLGNRVLSDMAVEAALLSLAPETASVRDSAFSRLDLYRKVNEAARTSMRRSNVTAAVGSGLHARLLRLNEEQRQVAALHAIIGFPYSDIASIMGKSESDVRTSYALMLLALRQKPAAVLIIEDEALIARELQEIVTKLGLIVAGMAKNRAEALRIAGASKPQLILADYKLKGDTGVDVVRAIRKNMDANVIYVTAHPEAVAASGDRRDLIIAKPFSVRAVEAAVQTHLAA